ncbi:MAG TPA: NUDIX pyrophosphatase [Ktedonobacterales bacterium]|nr:NUDIX pyrophosphatase [Ktedonobacterales bacterium]
MGIDDTSTQPTPVVTSFLLRRGPDGDRVLLLRRSGRVRTYQGAWAGVSGYLEPGVTPLEQAYTEIREETGIPRAAVRLLRAGEPLEFRDESLGQAWRVYPFLFALDEAAQIATDWETTEHSWAAPEELAAGTIATVPRLAEALALVYPPLPPDPEPSRGA